MLTTVLLTVTLCGSVSEPTTAAHAAGDDVTGAPATPATSEAALRDEARVSMHRIDELVKIFRVRHDRLPRSLHELLLPPTDPWGRPFVFKRLPHAGYDILCWGADHRRGGEGAAEDMRLSDEG